MLERGEAYFKVTKDPARPFVVEANAFAVRAVGTEFAVAHRKRELIVTVRKVRCASRRAPGSKATPRRAHPAGAARGGSTAANRRHMAGDAEPCRRSLRACMARAPADVPARRHACGCGGGIQLAKSCAAAGRSAAARCQFAATSMRRTPSHSLKLTAVSVTVTDAANTCDKANSLARSYCPSYAPPSRDHRASKRGLTVGSRLRTLTCDDTIIMGAYRFAAAGTLRAREWMMRASRAVARRSAL